MDAGADALLMGCAGGAKHAHEALGAGGAAVSGAVPSAVPHHLGNVAAAGVH